MILYFTAFG
jgi:hypothetical protein